MDILITGSTGKIGWALKNKIRELKPEWNVLEFKRTPDSDLKNESDIVRKFLEYNPDVVTGWNVKFFDMVDEQVWENLSNIYTLFNSQQYTTMRNFSENYQVSIDGKSVEKKDKTKKIA